MANIPEFDSLTHIPGIPRKHCTHRAPHRQLGVNERGAVPLGIADIRRYKRLDQPADKFFGERHLVAFAVHIRLATHIH